MLSVIHVGLTCNKETEGDELIRCVCGATSHDGYTVDEPWIGCEGCDVWQHNVCMGMSIFEDDLEDVKYYCEQCKPEEHSDLARGIDEGKKPWEEKRRQYEELKGAKEDEKYEKKGAKKSKKRPRVWKLGHELGVDGLCEHALDAMVKVQVATARVPSTSVLAKVWKDTPEGCSIRKLLLAWAVAYLHTSDSKAEFAKSLPQNVLSELAVAMVTSGTSPLVQLGSDSVHSKHAHPTRKSVHFVDQDGDEEPKPLYPVKKHRR
ncbi:hypothetical protein FJTKL_00933 [Diaporthe vaccinii]|uniref:PHD-type domain-containing protein n=1 Tax=Diaporthe vaccinii TaxID=105482 RepID=A0ABR4E1T5_9PEZI